jgi:hypothetical protein
MGDGREQSAEESICTYGGVTKGRRKLYNDELQDLYFSRSIISVMMSQTSCGISLYGTCVVTMDTKYDPFTHSITRVLYIGKCC